MFNQNYIIILTTVFLLLAMSIFASDSETKIYKIAVVKELPIIEGIHFKQGANIDPAGNTLTLNNLYLKYNDMPYFPIMGEFHYNRYPRDEWEEAVLKMKASGIQIVAFYTFWHLHEEIEGEIKFDDNRDVRAFIELCAKHGLWAFPRIGPWFHGEARYGGYPDWFANKFGGKFGGWGSFASGQHYSEEYWHYYEEWYKALADEFNGLYFKDGGPIIGLQFDNEVRSKGKGSPGYEYLKALKKMAIEYGMDVPIYSVTGWTGPVDGDELISTFGGYPDAPWAGHTNPIISSGNYSFTPTRRDEKIGSDLFKANIDYDIDTNTVYRNPYITAELGGGNQITYHRRVNFITEDLLALIYSRLGAGTNGNGYYVYHGSQHPLSNDLDHPTQESKASKYNLDYPMISYDFLSPITEWGFIRNYYHDYKLFHLFLEDFGSNLAELSTYLPEEQPVGNNDVATLRYSVRTKDKSGYVFYNTYCRNLKLNKHENVQFNLTLPDVSITLPDSPITLESGVYGLLPFNLKLEDVLLSYSTAHPFTKIETENKYYYFFYEQTGIAAEYKFDALTIEDIEISNGSKNESDGFIKVNEIKPGSDCQISLKSKNGKEIVITTLTYEQARYAYKFQVNNQSTLVFSNKQVMMNEVDKKLVLKSLDENAFTFESFPEISLNGEGFEKENTKNGLFTLYKVEQPKWESKGITFKDVSDVQKINDYVSSLSENPSGPTYSHIYDAEKPFRIYELTFPKDILSGQSNILAEFFYDGNTAQIYCDSVLIADDYFSGGPMPFGIARFKDEIQNSKFRFQITPLLPDYKIFFENNVDIKFSSAYNAKLLKIKLTPEYQFQFSIN